MSAITWEEFEKIKQKFKGLPPVDVSSSMAIANGRYETKVVDKRAAKKARGEQRRLMRKRLKV